jgi:hypothetical protein
MDFDEALRRYIGTDPSEICDPKVSEKPKTSKRLPKSKRSPNHNNKN